MKKLLSASFVLFATTVFAQTPTRLIESVIFGLNLRIEDCYEPLIVEMQMPDSPKESIVVIPKIAEIDEETFSLDSYILVVNNVSGKIKSKYFESHTTNGWTSDAVVLDQITIDTAPYQLQEKTRAFGIKVHFSGSSSIFPYESEVLTLFVTDGSKLVPVLKNLEVLSFNGEWNNDCDGESTERKSILSISASATNNYFDIGLATTVTKTINKPLENGDCEESSSAITEEKKLKFQEGNYVVN